MGCGASGEPKSSSTKPAAEQNAKPEDNSPVGVLEPFHLHVKILNKKEVIAAKLGNWWGVSGAANTVVTDEAFATKVAEKLIGILPPKVKEVAGIELTAKHSRSESEGTLFVVRMAVIGFDIAKIAELALGLDEENAASFAAAFKNVGLALQKMEMEERAKEVEAGVGQRVREGVMTKLVEKLPGRLEEAVGIKAEVNVPELQSKEEPACDDAGPAMSKLGLSTPFLLTLTINDRKALLDEQVKTYTKIGTQFTKFVGGALPDSTFNELLLKILKEQVPKQLEDRAGIQAECKRGADKGAGIQIEMVVKSYDKIKLLTLVKGEQFANAFQELWTALQKMASLGVAIVEEKMDLITEAISGRVREGVQTELTRVLTEKLHATVETKDLDTANP